MEISRAQSGGRLLVTVTDPALLEATGGIVQGMSGSPIIQNGKLVGAVTHVFVNDPTRGYGIFAETWKRCRHPSKEGGNDTGKFNKLLTISGADFFVKLTGKWLS